jgi:hypothetical protein
MCSTLNKGTGHPGRSLSMAVVWEFKGDILIVSLVAECGGHALRSAIETATTDAEFKPSTSLLLDLRFCTDVPSADEFRGQAKFLAAHTRKGLSHQCAIVVRAKPVDYGLARMASLYAELEGIGMEVFTNMEQGLRWLNKQRTSASD